MCRAKREKDASPSDEQEQTDRVPGITPRIAGPEPVARHECSLGDLDAGTASFLGLRLVEGDRLWLHYVLRLRQQRLLLCDGAVAEYLGGLVDPGPGLQEGTPQAEPSQELGDWAVDGGVAGRLVVVQVLVRVGGRRATRILPLPTK